MTNRMLPVALSLIIAVAALALALSFGQSVASQAPSPPSEATFAYGCYLPLALTPPRVTPSEWTTDALRNGDFEEDWGTEASNQALKFNTDGTIEEVAPTEIKTPPGWTAWFKHGSPVTHDEENKDGWAQPEVRDAWIDIDEYRVHGGEKGQLLFTFFKVHDAGFLQQIPVTVGAELRLSGWAHAWSSNGTHNSDPRWSEGEDVGYNEFFALDDEAGLDDAEKNFTFWLGIDPLGGTDPYTDSVVWGPGAHIYNAYRKVPTVTVTAQGPTATVFLRSKTLWRFMHNDAYWDDIVLEIRR
jgi:hypothetical protein